MRHILTAILVTIAVLGILWLVGLEFNFPLLDANGNIVRRLE